LDQIAHFTTLRTHEALKSLHIDPANYACILDHAKNNLSSLSEDDAVHLPATRDINDVIKRMAASDYAKDPHRVATLWNAREAGVFSMPASELIGTFAAAFKCVTIDIRNGKTLVTRIAKMAIWERLEKEGPLLPQDKFLCEAALVSAVCAAIPESEFDPESNAIVKYGNLGGKPEDLRAAFAIAKRFPDFGEDLVRCLRRTQPDSPGLK
jgi:hypothetical protein